MIKKITIAIILIAIMAFAVIKFNSCLRNIELNTVNPQASNSIADSKQNGFFMVEYKLSSTDFQKGITLNDTWVEHLWKNTLVDGKRGKEQLEQIQLVMKTNSLERLGFSDSTSLTNWEIEVEGNHLSGIGGGMYIIYLASKTPPDTIKVNVSHTAKESTAVYKPISFLLVKQQ